MRGLSSVTHVVVACLGQSAPGIEGGEEGSEDSLNGATCYYEKCFTILFSIILPSALGGEGSGAGKTRSAEHPLPPGSLNKLSVHNHFNDHNHTQTEVLITTPILQTVKLSLRKLKKLAQDPGAQTLLNTKSFTQTHVLTRQSLASGTAPLLSSLLLPLSTLSHIPLPSWSCVTLSGMQKRSKQPRSPRDSGWSLGSTTYSNCGIWSFVELL